MPLFKWYSLDVKKGMHAFSSPNKPSQTNIVKKQKTWEGRKFFLTMVLRRRRGNNNKSPKFINSVICKHKATVTHVHILMMSTWGFS